MFSMYIEYCTAINIEGNRKKFTFSQTKGGIEHRIFLLRCPSSFPPGKELLEVAYSFFKNNILL
jgi:hypothetical protein